MSADLEKQKKPKHLYIREFTYSEVGNPNHNFIYRKLSNGGYEVIGTKSTVIYIGLRNNKIEKYSHFKDRRLKKYEIVKYKLLGWL